MNVGFLPQRRKLATNIAGERCLQLEDLSHESNGCARVVEQHSEADSTREMGYHLVVCNLRRQQLWEVQVVCSARRASTSLEDLV